MDKICISSLISSSITDKPISVNSLQYQHEEKKEIPAREKINIKELKNSKEEKKKKLIKEYDKILNICLSKIKMANRYDKSEIIYHIPEMIFGVPNYKMKDCLSYVQDELIKLEFKIDNFNNDIYIRWC